MRSEPGQNQGPDETVMFPPQKAQETEEATTEPQVDLSSSFEDKTLAEKNSLAVEMQAAHYVDERAREILNQEDEPEVRRERTPAPPRSWLLRHKFYSICLASLVGLALGISLAFLLMMGFFDPIAKLIKMLF